MKNQFISAIMVSAMALQLVACGAAETVSAQGAEFEAVAGTDSAKEATEATVSEGRADAGTQDVAKVAETSAETPSEEAAATEPFDFEGQYYAGRGNLSITQKEDGNFLMEVWWGSSASEHSEWVMSGSYDEASATISYSDCEKHDYTLKGDGEVDKDVTAYTGGTGNIRIVDDNTIIWTDDQDHLADDVPMTR